MTKPIENNSPGEAQVPPRSGLKAPFPWFGGKSRAAHLVWPRFGDVPNYVEPFAGSLAVLLRRPPAPGNEIVNDLDCYVSNAWRAMQAAPDEVAKYCDWPVNEADLHARHRWLHGRTEFRQRMENDPDYFDARIAGFWIWGLSCWIGDNFCRPNNQNSIPKLKSGGVCGQISDLRDKGITRKIPYISKPGGQGVARQVPRLRAGGGGIQIQHEPTAAEGNIPHKRPSTQRKNGRGCQAPVATTWRKRPELESDKGIFQPFNGAGAVAGEQLANLEAWFAQLAARLRHVKVCCGDWQRVCTKAATYGQGLTGVLLDPPYDPKLCDTVYGGMHSASVSREVKEWALANGSNPSMRIALCGYIGEHDMPADWECVAWKANGGYAAAAGNTENSKKQRIWFSPYCLKPAQNPELF